jgi:hypothetical protein
MPARVLIRFVSLVVAALAALTAAACEHGEPFLLEPYGPVGPQNPGLLTRLTFNPGQDLAPVWLPDGSAFAYTGERGDRDDRDRCLAFMPGMGGAIVRYACRTSVADDSINVFEDAAFARDSVVYVRASTERFLQGIGPDAQQLVVAAAGDPNDARVLHGLPFTAGWGATYDALSHLVWLGPGRVAAVAERVTYPRSCRSCAPDTVRTGVATVIIDFGTPAPILARLAAADSASSLAASPAGDTLYFTRVGDARVYRHAFASGQTDTLYDFGSLGIARDVSIAGGKLAAVVGGLVSYSVDSILGGSQPDHGGPLYLVTSGGAPLQIGDTAWRLRRPALSPDATRLVVAVWHVAPAADLWMIELP